MGARMHFDLQSVTMSRPRATPTAAESLLRWLAGWLAVALLAQALTFGAAAVSKPSHRHGSAPQVESKPMLLWRHAADGVRNDAAAAHVRAHLADEPHQHPIDDASLLPTGSDAAAAEAATLAALIAAPAPRAGAALTVASSGLHHVWSAGDLWAPTARTVTPPRHPPRA
jgi:hypothetical protein